MSRRWLRLSNQGRVEGVLIPYAKSLLSCTRHTINRTYFLPYNTDQPGLASALVTPEKTRRKNKNKYQQRLKRLPPVVF